MGVSLDMHKALQNVNDHVETMASRQMEALAKQSSCRKRLAMRIHRRTVAIQAKQQPISAPVGLVNNFKSAAKISPRTLLYKAMPVEPHSQNTAQKIQRVMPTLAAAIETAEVQASLRTLRDISSQAQKKKEDEEQGVQMPIHQGVTPLTPPSLPPHSRAKQEADGVATGGERDGSKQSRYERSRAKRATRAQRIGEKAGDRGDANLSAG